MSTTRSLATASDSSEFCPCTRPTECVDRRPGRYLTAIYWLTHDHEARVSTGTISDLLEVAPASATEMVDRLAGMGLLIHERRGDVELTDHGTTVAVELAWRQRVVRRFFAANAGGEIGATVGYRIGYHLPEEAIDRLVELVEEPRARR